MKKRNYPNALKVEGTKTHNLTRKRESKSSLHLNFKKPMKLTTLYKRKIKKFRQKKKMQIKKETKVC